LIRLVQCASEADQFRNSLSRETAWKYPDFTLRIAEKARNHQDPVGSETETALRPPDRSERRAVAPIFSVDGNPWRIE